MSTFAGHVGWDAFAAAAPALAEAGRALLSRPGEGVVAFLATVSAAGAPRLAPVCPIFCDADVWLSVGADTLKRHDLDHNGRYVLHGLLGADDAEFKISGLAERTDDEPARRRVQAAIPFPAWDPADPIYRLWIGRCLYVYWMDQGRPGTRPVRRLWTATR